MKAEAPCARSRHLRYFMDLEPPSLLEDLLDGRLDMPRVPGYMIGSQGAQIINI